MRENFVRSNFFAFNLRANVDFLINKIFSFLLDWGNFPNDRARPGPFLHFFYIDSIKKAPLSRGLLGLDRPNVYQIRKSLPAKLFGIALVEPRLKFGEFGGRHEGEIGGGVAGEDVEQVHVKENERKSRAVNTFSDFFSVQIGSRSVRVHGHTKRATVAAVAGFHAHATARRFFFDLVNPHVLREEGIRRLLRLAFLDSLVPDSERLISSDFVFHAAKIGGGGTKAIFFVFNSCANSERLINK